MLEQFNKAIAEYESKWQKLVAARSNQDFFKSLQPTSIGWKVEDLAEFDQTFKYLRSHCDQIHLGWVNERWLASLHLKDTELEDGIKIIKLMQRRPGSDDLVGLDHVDFYSPEVDKKLLVPEKNLKWSEENNGQVCKWISIWFDGTEAKLRTDSVLDVCIEELREANAQVLDNPKH